MSVFSSRGTVGSNIPSETSPNASRGMRLYCGLSYLFFLGAFTHVFGSSEAAGSGPLDFLFLPAALAIQITATVLLFGPKRLPCTIALLNQNRALILAVALIAVSTVWSIDSELTFRRAVALAGTTAVGFLIYIEIGRKDLLGFFASYLAVFVVGSVLMALAMPTLGTHVSGKHVGDWRGLLGYKNQAAWTTAIFLLVLLGTKQHGRLRTWRIPLLALGVLMLIKTGSATGIAAIAFGLSVLIVLWAYSGAPSLRPLIVIATIAALAIVAINFSTFFSWALDVLGRDESLTGRTSVWTSLWPLIENNFWLGSGYLAFWDHAGDYFGSSSWMVGIQHAHNAYVEILLDVGVVGLITQSAFLLVTCWRLTSRTVDGDSGAAAILAILLTLAFIGIAGALFFRPNSGIWIMIVAFACYAANNDINERGSYLPKGLAT